MADNVYDSYAARAAELITAMESASDNTDNKMGEDLALYILDMIRGVVIMKHLSPSRSSRNSTLHPSLRQIHFPVYDKDMQEPDPVTGKFCNVIFELPQVVLVDDLIDGMNYIGGTGGRSPFRRIRSRTTLTGILNHSVTKPSEDVIYAYTRPDNKVEIYGDAGLQEIMVDAAFEMPSRVANVNWDTDRYPINNALMGEVIMLSSQLILNKIYADPQDTIQDMQRQVDKLKTQIRPK